MDATASYPLSSYRMSYRIVSYHMMAQSKRLHPIQDEAKVPNVTT